MPNPTRKEQNFFFFFFFLQFFFLVTFMRLFSHLNILYYNTGCSKTLPSLAAKNKKKVYKYSKLLIMERLFEHPVDNTVNMRIDFFYLKHLFFRWRHFFSLTTHKVLVIPLDNSSVLFGNSLVLFPEDERREKKIPLSSAES